MNTLSNTSKRARGFWRTSALALASFTLAASVAIPVQAGAITPSTATARAHTWVRHRVMYSQTRYHRGYRRDCSGFVSMAWKAGTSFTSRTIQRYARRIPISKLRRGDAVHTPGHVALFVKWKNKRRRTFVVMEESSYGTPAHHSVRRITRRSTAYRYKHMSNPVMTASMPMDAPSAADTTALVSTASVLPTDSTVAPSIAPTGSLDTTLTWTTQDALSLFQ